MDLYFLLQIFGRDDLDEIVYALSPELLFTVTWLRLPKHIKRVNVLSSLKKHALPNCTRLKLEFGCKVRFQHNLSKY